MLCILVICQFCDCYLLWCSKDICDIFSHFRYITTNQNDQPQNTSCSISFNIFIIENEHFVIYSYVSFSLTHMFLSTMHIRLVLFVCMYMQGIFFS